MYKVEIEIAKPVREVYAAFNNADNMPRWLTGLQRYEQISGEPGKVGSTARQIYLERGRTVELIETITAHEPEKHFAGTISGQGMNCMLEVDFVDRGQTTLVIMRSDFKPGSWIMRLLLPFFKKGICKRQEGDLHTFRGLVESGELRG